MKNISKAIAYVDGSYNPKNNHFSYGCVILFNDNKVELYEEFNDDKMAMMRNVSGEIIGATQAMLYCLNHNIDELDLYYDYMGIECWCTGAWHTNKTHTRAYADFYQKIKKKLKVNFYKVKGHSGDEYNDLADKLAKKALGL